MAQSTASGDGPNGSKPASLSGRSRSLWLLLAGGMLLAALAGLAWIGRHRLGNPTISGQSSPPAPPASASAATTPTLGASEPSSADQPHTGGIAALLAHPPPALATVAVDAYHGEGYRSWPGRGRAESMSGCPSSDSSPLVDQPLWQTIHFGGTSSSNHPPPESPWLIAAGPRAGGLPRFGRLQGHLGDPQFAHCNDAERIFVVESVVEVYEPRSPDWPPTPDLSAWTEFETPGGGAQLRYPASWTIAANGDGTWALSNPDLPAYPLTLQVLRTDAVPETTQTAVADRRLPGGGYWRNEAQVANSGNRPRLEGDTIFCNGYIQDGCVEVRFTQAATTYVFRQEYGSGFDYDPRVLASAQDILDTFEIMGRATITPVPPPKAALGPGTFWTREQAERMALDMIQGAITLPTGSWRVRDAQLVPEAEALARGGCDMHRASDNQGYTYPDGVWLLELTGAATERELVYFTYLDASTGYHLCTEGQPR